MNEVLSVSDHTGSLVSQHSVVNVAVPVTVIVVVEVQRKLGRGFAVVPVARNERLSVLWLRVIMLEEVSHTLVGCGFDFVLVNAHFCEGSVLHIFFSEFLIEDS